MNDKIAIIGGSGFIGSCLCKIFKKNHINYMIYDIAQSLDKNYMYLDVRSPESFAKIENSSCIINLAAEHRDDVTPLSRYDDVNVNGAENICNAARKFNINKIIFTSSVAIYGSAKPNTGENGDINFFNDYGRTKYEAELIYKKWLNEDPKKRTLIIVRPTVVFGEYNRGNVYNLLKQISSRKFIIIGDGNNIKSMAYVQNVADFLLFSLGFKKGLHVHNYIDKPDMTINQLVAFSKKIMFNKNYLEPHLPASLGILVGRLFDIFAKITKRKFPISTIRVKKFMETTQFSSNINMTGFQASTSLEEGLKKTIQHEFLKRQL